MQTGRVRSLDDVVVGGSNMVLTGINEDNLEYFAPFLKSSVLSGNEIYIGAIEDGRAVSAAAFSCDDKTLLIDSIFVVPDMRRRGIATAILDEIFKTAALSGAEIVFASVAADAEFAAFLEKKGFALIEDSDLYLIPVSRILDSENTVELFTMVKNRPMITERTVILDELTDRDIKALSNKLIKDDLAEAAGMLMGTYDPELSCVLYKSADKKDISAILIADREGDRITIKYLSNISSNPRNLIIILKIFNDILIKKGLRNGVLSFCVVNKEIVTVLYRLLGYYPKPAGKMMAAYRDL